MASPLPPLAVALQSNLQNNTAVDTDSKPGTVFPRPGAKSPKQPLTPLRLVADFDGSCECTKALGDGQHDEDGQPCVVSISQMRRDYAADAIRRAKEKRDREAAHAKRKQALKDLMSLRAKQKVLANFENEEIRVHAMARLVLEEPSPELLAPLLDEPKRPRPKLVASASASLLRISSHHCSTPKIDFHQHCISGDEEGLQALLAANAEWGIKQCVLLSLRLLKSTRSDVRSRNEWVLQMAGKYPEVIPFVTVIEDDPLASRMFKECLDRGARGLKLIGWHSEYIKKHDYDLCNPALMDVFRLAAVHSVPVLLHLWIGYSKTKKDYLQSLDKILIELPALRLVLAHFGLGFDPDTLPGIIKLARRHRNLYVDTSLYGSNCELWFMRGSNQAGPLASFVRQFPKQVLFGTDVFGSRLKQRKELNDAMSASISFLMQEKLVCEEFKVTDYIATTKEDKYGLVAFDPLHLNGLHLQDDPELLRRVFRQNALDILDLGLGGRAGG